MDFTKDMKRIAQAMGEDISADQREITLEIFNSVIIGTRVDTGRARGNWQTTVGVPATGETDRLFPKGTPENSLTSESRRKYEPASLMILSNNLPYIGKLEELDGMVGLTIARVGRNIQEKARKS